MQVSHLQFADDMNLFIEPKFEYLVILRRILRCSKMASGLKINFFKSCIANVGKNRRVKVNWEDAFRCKKVSLPILYLGLPLGGNLKSKVFRNPVVEKIERRLALWKVRFLLKSGSLTLIKAALTSIPTYYKSVFKMSIGVAHKIEKLQNNFFWGDGIVRKRIHMID